MTLNENGLVGLLSEEQLKRFEELLLSPSVLGDMARPCDDYFLMFMTPSGENTCIYLDDAADSVPNLKLRDMVHHKLYKTPTGYMFYIFLSDAYFIEQVTTDYEIAKERVEAIIIADRLRRENGEKTSEHTNGSEDNSNT